MSEQMLAARLKADTAALHESMHVLMGQLAPFAARDRYVRFVAAQFVFQCRVNALAENDWMRAVVPDLSLRSRVDAAARDLADLDTEMTQACRAWVRDAPAVAADVPPQDGTLPARALGWLYVSEGSTLGAAFLFKQAQDELGLSAEFGARNLAASPAGRAQAWRTFVALLDAAVLTPQQADQAIEGAREAFGFFGRTLADAFGEAVPEA